MHEQMGTDSQRPRRVRCFLNRGDVGRIPLLTICRAVPLAGVRLKVRIHFRLLTLSMGMGCVLVAGHLTLLAAETGVQEHVDRAGQVDPFYQERNQRAAREQQEQYRERVAITDAVRHDVPTAESIRLAAIKRANASSQQPPAGFLESSHTLLLVIAALLLTALIFGRKFVAGFLKAVNAEFNPWVAGSAMSVLSTKVRAEEDSLSELLAAFRAGPTGGAGDVDGAASTDPGVRAAAIKAFHDKTARMIETQRMVLQEINRTSNEGGLQKLLAALRWEMHVMRGEAGVPELLPVWQMTFALEGLLKQLIDNAENVTHSSLRTLTGGVELLGKLCHPDVAPDLLTRQPLRLLAVDDDPISRRAVASALKRALNEPELAEQGEAALVLAKQNEYDVIFLDVEMPGMDGFELCSRIHETGTNRSTPVVFVTGHSDFDARAKSTLSGGSDLIGKPFLTFEITVKALTLALRGRLAARAQDASAVEAEAAIAATSLSDDGTVAETVTDCAQSSQTFTEAGAGTSVTIESEEIATTFLMRASVHLTPLREAFQTLLRTPDEAARQELLSDVFLRIHSLSPKTELPAMHPAMQMTAALEGLLRKMLEQPRHVTRSSLGTLAAGVELFEDLCALGAQPDFLTNPPVHMLVVDDDPISRRAVTFALQIAFDKPDSADCGDVALALAAERRYDVVFLDVQMPGMDGFEVCGNIRGTTANGDTPVVFVTGHSDSKMRARARECGGSDFVEKPFLTAEITLKALTFALRGRMERLEGKRAQLTGSPVS